MDDTVKTTARGMGAGGAATDSAAGGQDSVPAQDGASQDGAFNSAMLESLVVAGTDPDIVELYCSLPARATAGTGRLIDEELVVMDTETTGLDPVHDELIEISACIVRGNEVVAHFDTFVDPGRAIPPAISELTGITEDDVAGAPDPGVAVEQFAEFAGGRRIVAHNASFDRGFIMHRAAAGTVSKEWLDSLVLSNIVLPRLKSHRLEDLSRAFGVHASTHRADDDVAALAALWPILVAGAYALPDGLAARIASIAPGTPWPLRTVFHDAAQASAGGEDEGEDGKFRLGSLRHARIGLVPKESNDREDGAKLTFPSDEELDADFSAQGVAGAMYPGFEPREPQLQMAHEVLDAFRDGECRVLEAGTGVGKSMAYLLPAARIARANGVHIGVATKTNALTDQLMYHELPDLARALGGLNYVSLKGYDHYLCLRKLQTLYNRDDLDVEGIEFAATLLGFTAHTTWGDLGALRIRWPYDLRDEVVPTPENCLKKKNCPFRNQCYLHGARAHAEKADIIVTNHALLFRDMETNGAILPEGTRHWVIDEAHAVEEEARSQLSAKIDVRDLKHLLRQIDGNGGLLAQAKGKAGRTSGANVLYAPAAKVEGSVGDVRESAESFFSFVKNLYSCVEDPGSYYEVDVWISDELRQSAAWDPVAQTGAVLADNLEELEKALQDLVCALEECSDEGGVSQGDVSSIACRVGEMRSALALVLGDENGANKDYAYAAHVHRKPERVIESLSALRLDIGSALAEQLYPNVDSVIFTSATIATGKSDAPFASFLHAVGLDRIEQDRFSCRTIESSYDFNRNMRILLPAEMPDPYDPSYHERLVELLYEVHVAMGGSTLTLFTNRNEMQSYAAELRERLEDAGLELAVQPPGAGRHAVRERFIAEEKLSLFALKAFWEGFDAPGDTLRCVIIPKLPFESAKNPLLCERTDREGRSAWARYSLPKTIVEMKQAAGRLIRRSDDSGFLVLADGRLQKKSYRTQVLQAMPSNNMAVEPLDDIVAEMRAARR